MTLREWLVYHQKHIVFSQVSWMGLRALKNPLDAWIYQEILREVRPEVVIEIGSFEGGGTLFIAHMLDLIGDGMVLSIDTDHGPFQAEHLRIRKLTGSSSSPEVFATVAEICHNKRVLVIHDGDHRKFQVKTDLDLYSRLVSVGSYFIVEDGIVDLFRPGEFDNFAEEGPLKATEAFLDEHPEFESDESRERYILTYNPRGFLRRMR